MRAFCDFDGTISKQDVTDLVLERFALPQWHDLERDWLADRITAAECMRRQIALLHTERRDLDLFLDGIEIDPHFSAFKRLCDKNRIGITVVSDGVDYFIRRILMNHGMADIEIIANRLVMTNDGAGKRFSLALPFERTGCRARSGVCKCAVIAPAGPHFYVGDSRSDFCVSHEAMFVFAKYKLIDHCEANHIPYVAYRDFADVARIVASIMEEPAWLHALQRASKSA